MRICVYCSSSETIDPTYVDLAAQVGARIAADGHSLVSGGGRVSMMGAVAGAARAGGAHTLGVIPRGLFAVEVGDTEGELRVVDGMRERKRVMDDNSDAFLALPGGLGTLDELIEVWTTSYLGAHPRPVVVLDPFGFYDPLWAWLQALVEPGFVRQHALDGLVRAGTVQEAFEALAAPAATGHATAAPRRTLRLGTADAGEVLTLQRAAYLPEARTHGDFELPPLRQDLVALTAELDDPQVLALGSRDDRGRLVAAVRARVRRDDDGAWAEVGRLTVAPDRQGAGLGTGLLAALEEQLPDEVAELRLFTGERSHANLRLYRRLGFVETSREPTAAGYDLVHLRRRRQARGPA